MSTPQPLPAYSAKLRDRRYECWVGGPKNERGSYPFVAEGRFTSFEDAKSWADQAHPDSPTVIVTYYAALNGWRRDSAGARIDGSWNR